MKKLLVRAFQILVAIGVLVWVFRDRQMRGNIPLILHQANLYWILLGIAFAGVGELANIFRWHIFLKIQNVRVPLARTATVFMIGVFFNLFLFGATGGDVVRAAYLCADQKRKKGGVILSVVADRLIGMIVLIPFGVVVVLLRFRWFHKTPTAAALLWFLIIFMVVLTVFFAFAITVTSLGVTSKLPPALTAHKSFRQLLDACALFGRGWRETLIAYGLSFPVLFGPFATFYCAGRAFDAHVSLMDMFSITPIVTIVTSLPISFSGIGVREQLFKNLLGDLCGVPAVVAVLISLSGFLSYISWSLVGAAVYLGYKPARTRKR